MKLSDLAPPAGARKKRKRVGRGPGSGHGRYSCRGLKGQKARSGARRPPWFEGGQMPLQRRIPKRGFTNLFKNTYQVVNLAQLSIFAAESAVTPEILWTKRLVRKKGIPIKVLGCGELTVPLRIRAHAFSQKAIQKIKSAGGKHEVI